MPPKLFGQLLRMDFPELATRSRQEAFKWIEAIRPRHRNRRAEHSDEALRDFNSNYHDIFFAGAVDARALAAHASPIVAAANRLLSGHFDLLGYSGLNFGDPLDWHFDPVSGRRAPRRHWTSIDGEDYAAIGDPKVIGELNRHQWLVTLAQAYKLTREEGYAAAVMRYLQSWLRENPVGIGINWTSSLELALRLIAWSWALVLIAESRAMNGARFAALLESVRAQAVHVERYMSHYFSPNTHLTGEALGLFYAGVLFTQLKSAPRWRSVGLRVLVQEIERQVLPDGVYFERTTCYQRYTIETYLHLMILARRLGIELPPSVEKRVRAMLDFILPMRHADGCVPSIGDADGGRLLPLSRTEPGDFGPCFSTAAVLFNDATYAWAAGELSAETVWLLGSDAIDTFEALQPEPPGDPDTSRAFSDGGFSIMRSGWEPESHLLIFDHGPLGCQHSGGHGHADLLSIQCSVFGKPYIVDPGVFCYGIDRPLRDFFRGTAAHSSVRIDGKDHAEPAGTFSWRTRPAARLEQWRSGAAVALADAVHDAYRTTADAVRHRRRIVFVKRRFWMIVDDIAGKAEHEVELRFQFAPMRVRVDDAGWVRATRDGKCGLLVRAFAAAPLDEQIREGRRDPLEGWFAPNYGKLEPAPVLVYNTATQLPFRAVTILWPSEDVQRETPAVEYLANKALIVD